MQPSKIEKNLAGDYKFDVKDVLTRATDLSKTNTFVIFAAALIMFAANIVLILFTMQLHGIETLEQMLTSQSDSLVLSMLVISVFIAPMGAGVTMMSIFSARGLSVRPSWVFAYYSMLPVLGIVSVFLDLMLQIGIQLFILPAFYVLIVSTFVIPLIADKKLGPLSAIILSVKMANRYLFQMCLVYLVFAALAIAGMLSFLIGFIWIIPFIYNVKAIIYQDLFCEPSESIEHNTEKTGVFDA